MGLSPLDPRLTKAADLSLYCAPVLLRDGANNATIVLHLSKIVDGLHG